MDAINTYTAIHYFRPGRSFSIIACLNTFWLWLGTWLTQKIPKTIFLWPIHVSKTVVPVWMIFFYKPTERTFGFGFAKSSFRATKKKCVDCLKTLLVWTSVIWFGVTRWTPVNLFLVSSSTLITFILCAHTVSPTSKQTNKARQTFSYK